MKTCFKCHRVLSESEFYAHPRMGDGLLGKCKECTKSDVRTHRANNIERMRAYDRARAALPHRAELRRRVGENYRNRYPGRAALGLRTRRAYRTAPSACEHCGIEARLERHHPDYSQHLLIEWLCKPCHWKADQVRRQKEQAA